MAKTDKFVELLKSSGINPNVIYDIGAYDCAETVELAKAFPQSQVYAFECVPKMIGICAERLENVKNAHLFPIALGDRTGIELFNESTSSNGECGSFLQPNGAYWEPMPMRKIWVPMFKLDDVLKPWTTLRPPDAIWMDVQGYETQVLKGMGDYFSKVRMIWAEITYTPYYEGQPKVAEFDRVMNLWGYDKVHEEVAMPDWFGNACYQRKS